MMRNVWLGLLPCLLATLLMFGFTGCAAPQPKTNEQTIELELWTLQLGTFDAIINPMLRAFEKTHPGVTVRWVDVPFSQGEKRAITAMLSPNVPDVINLNPDFAALLAARAALLNMNEALTTEEQAVYLPAAWQACTLNSSLRPSNQGQSPVTFGVPWYLTSSVLVVNQSLLNASPPSNLTQLAHLNTKENQQAYRFFPYIASSGGLLKALFAHGLYAPGESVAAVLRKKETAIFLNQWKQLFASGAIPREILTDGPQAAVELFQANRLVMMNTGTNFLNIIKENAPGVYKKTAVYSQFPAKTKHPLFSTMLLAVPSKSRHPQLAAQLAQWITNTNNQLLLAAAAPVLPSTVQGVEQLSTLKTTYNEDAKQLAARTLSARQLLSATSAYPAIPHQKTIHNWADHYTQAALLGTMSITAALNEAANKIDALE